MALLDTFRPVSALSKLLDKEREAILKSDFETLQSLAKPKEKLVSLVARSRTPASRLTALQKRLEHNKRLLLASAKGIHAARENLVAISFASNDFTTYGPQGVMTKLSSKPLTIKKKS